MTARSPIEQAVAVLRDGPIALSTHADTAARRERMLPVLRHLVQGTPSRLRQQRLVRRSFIALGALAAVSAGLVLPRYLSSLETATPTVLVEETGPVGNGPRRLATTGSLQASEQAGLRLVTDRGIEITLTPKSTVALDTLTSEPQHPALILTDGTVRCRVPKLPVPSTFVVRTENTEIIVHGTVFSVTTRGPNNPACVVVEEGLVEVRHNQQIVMVGRGQSNGCGNLPEAPLAATQLTEPEPAKATTPSPRRPRAIEPASNGSLEAEAQLLSRALVAERSGKPVEAHRLFGNFLRRYPNSTLQAEAAQGFARTQAGNP